jgi:hypothetical protein
MSYRRNRKQAKFYYESLAKNVTRNIVTNNCETQSTRKELFFKEKEFQSSDG